MGYKLLTQDMKTRKGELNETDWSDVGEWHEATGTGGLCSDGVLHDYDDPWIAVVMNPAHANIGNPVMYETERGGRFLTDMLKCGSRRMRLLGRVDLPDIPLLQKVAFGILAALEGYPYEKFRSWAMDWLSGKDRSASAAEAAVKVASAARDAAAYVAARYAAAYAAAYDAAADADAAAIAADAAYDAAAAARAGNAAYAAAYAAAETADAADMCKKIDWKRIKTEAMKIS